MTSPDMLASDREREATILRLRAAHLEGRIDTEELEARVGRAHAVSTRRELDALVADLPARLDVPPAGGAPRVPGRRRFAVRRVVEGAPAEVRERLLTEVLPPLAVAGFYVHREEGDTIGVENRLRTGSRFTVRLRDAGDHRTLVVAEGAAPLRVRRALASL